MAKQHTGDPALFKKKASFIQHSLPGLEAGRYQIFVQQSLKDSSGKDITTAPGNPEGGLPSISKNFGVIAPRYSLDKQAVHSVFPPAFSAGEFSNSLAHIVLEQEKLPWLRSPYEPGKEPYLNQGSYTTTIDGKEETIEYDEDKATWLGVLLLSPSDLDGQAPLNSIQQGTVLDLVPYSLNMYVEGGSPQAGKLPADHYSIFSYLLAKEGNKNTVDAGVGKKASDAVHYIDIPAAVFETIAPSLSDLNMIAHVREVEMAAKAIPPDQQVKPLEKYSLVIGNRLPESLPKQDPNVELTAPAKGSNVAFLVSLEHMQGALRDHEVGNYFDKHIASNPAGFVRVIVLYSWSFTSWEDTSFEFETLLKSMNGHDPQAVNNSVNVPNAQLRMPDPPTFTGGNDTEQVVADMLASGFMPFTHHSRVAHENENTVEPIQTISWYRGPLIPCGAFSQELAFMSEGSPTFFSSDQLLRFDPNVGLYDVSYAMAWQLGRLLSLQNKDFSVALYRWKKQVEQQLRVLMEEEVLENNFDALINLEEQISSLENDDAAASSRQLYKNLLTQLSGNPNT